MAVGDLLTIKPSNVGLLKQWWSVHASDRKASVGRSEATEGQ